MRTEITDYEDFIMSNGEQNAYVAPVIMNDYNTPAMTRSEEVATAISNYLNYLGRLEYLNSFGSFFISFAGMYCVANAALFLLQQL